MRLVMTEVDYDTVSYAGMTDFLRDHQ